MPPGPWLVDCGNPVALDHPLNRGLVAWYYGLPTNSGGMYLYDLMGQYTVLDSGSSRIRWNGQRDGHGAAISNTGTTQRFELAAVPVAALPLTMACWFNKTNAGFGTAVALGTAGAADPSRYALQVGGTGSASARATVVDSAGTENGGNSTQVGYQSGKWGHACGVWRTTTSRSGYFNGQNKGTNTSARTASAPTVTNVAASQTTTGTYTAEASCLIADIAIWNRALDDSEIAWLYEEGVAGNPTRLRRYTPRVWSFGGTQSTHTATGGLTAGAATLSASATHTPPSFTATGDLGAAPATLSADATFVPPSFTGSGDLAAGPASLAAGATFAEPVYTGSGDLAAAPAVLAASATFAPPVYTGAGDLAAGVASLAGVATFTAPVYTGSGDLSAGAAAIAGGAAFTAPVYSGSGDLAAGIATLAASASFTAPVYSGSGELASGPATLTASATFVPPSFTGSGDLTAGAPTLVGVATFSLATFTGTGDLIAGAATLVGVATFTALPPPPPPPPPPPTKFGGVFQRTDTATTLSRTGAGTALNRPDTDSGLQRPEVARALQRADTDSVVDRR